MDIHPDSAVIDALGGPTAVAGLCRISSQAVSQWRRTGIPSARRDYLSLLRPQAFEASSETAAASSDPQASPAEVRDAA